jgi:hypothetical protein
MSDHHRKLFTSLGGELAALIHSEASKDPAERAAGARRWQEITKRSERPPKEAFRHDLRGILSTAVQRLEELRGEVESERAREPGAISPDDRSESAGRWRPRARR